MKVNASGQQEVVKLVLLWMFPETCRRDGGFVSLKVYVYYLEGKVGQMGIICRRGGMIVRRVR
jgi:hypothetical protein